MNHELFQRIYKLSQNKPNEFSSAFNLADLVPWVHLQFANLLEKQTSKKYIFLEIQVNIICKFGKSKRHY